MSEKVKGITLEIGGDTKGLTKALSEVNSKSNGVRKELKEIESALKLDPSNTELLAQKQKVLASSIDLVRQKLKALENAKEKADKDMREGTEINTKEYRKLGREILNTRQQLKKLESQSTETSDTISAIGKSEKNVQALKKTFSTAAKGGAAFLGTVVAIGVALSEVEENTREYREDLNKLKVGFESSGKSVISAKKAYSDFYGILGESDRAVEAVNHLAELTKNEKELSQWTTIAAGVNAKFTDSLPIEGLTEASNETAKMGKVTGVLADALNWVAGLEDTVNENLSKMNSEQERASYITQVLSDLYSETGETYLETNASIIANREAQAEWNDAMARVGELVASVKAEIVSLGAAMLSGTAEIAEAAAGLGDSNGEVKRINKELEEMRTNFETVTESAEVGQEKIETWKQLKDQIDGGTLSSARLKDAQAKIKEIEQWFIDNYGSYISAEEEKNGMRDKTIEKLGEELNTRSKIAQLEAQTTLAENVDKIREIEFETELLKGKTQALWEQNNALHDSASKITQAQAEWDLFCATEDFVDLEKRTEKVNELNAALEGVLTLDVYRVDSMLPDAFEVISRQMEMVNNEISNNKDIIKENEKTINEYKLGVETLASVAPEIVDTFRVTREGVEGEMEKQAISNAGYYAQMVEGTRSGYQGINDEVLIGAAEQFNNTLTEYEKIGGNIPEGLRLGIEKTKEALKKGVKAFVTELKSWFTAPDALDEHSPSKWSEKVAAFVDDGLAIGFIKNSEKVRKSMRELFGMMEEERKAFTEDITLEEERYNKELERIRAEGTEKANEAYLEGLKKLADEAKEKRDFIRKQYGEAVEDIKDAISDLEKEMESYRSGLSKTDLLGEDKYILTIDGKETEFTTPVLADLSGKRAELETFIKNINALKEMGIDDTMIEQIQELGGEEGGKLAQALLNATPEMRKTFIDDFKKIGELSGEATAEVFQKELVGVADDLKVALDELAPDLLQTGENWGHYLGQGIVSKLDAALKSVGIMADYALPAGGGTVVNYNTNIENNIQATPNTANEVAESQRRAMENLKNWGQIT